MANRVLESFALADQPEDWGSDMGLLLSSALTTFVAVPSSAQVSFAMTIMYDGFGCGRLCGGSHGPLFLAGAIDGDRVRDRGGNQGGGAWGGAGASRGAGVGVMKGPYRQLERIYGSLPLLNRAPAAAEADGSRSRSAQEGESTEPGDDAATRAAATEISEELVTSITSDIAHAYKISSHPLPAYVGRI